MKLTALQWKKEEEREVNPFLLHQVVVKELASRRQGCAKVKNRHEVVGSTRKIYRQKGTGNARHGDIKAPLFVGGGQAFGPKPRDWSYVLPQKLRRGAMRSALALRDGEKKLWLLDFDLKEPKTQKAGELFSASKIGNALVVLGEEEGMAEKSIRNLKNFEVRGWNQVSVSDVLKHEHLVVTETAWKKLEGRVS